MQNYVGQQIDRYRIIERLGMGGMAVVYKAFDTRLERDVALKLIRVDEIPASQHERLMKRFEREAKAMAKFSHPNIVPVHDFGEVDGSPYLVMEYIPGGTLKDKTGKPVPVETALSWIAPIADALAYAHEFGVIHRDVKPSNILFDQKGRPILTDFGIAKVLETGETNLTGTGLGVGTPEYMAPEQWRGKASEATDQYSLGIVLYELLTGQKPYKADTPAALVILQATEPMPQPSKLVKGIPDEVEKVLYKALARDPQDRYEDMEALRKALESLFSGYTELPGEANNEELVDVVDEILEEKTPKNSSLSASEIEHIELKANPIESHNELKGEEETFDVLDSSPSNEMKIHNNVQEDMNKGQDGYSMGTHPKESPKISSDKFFRKSVPVVIGVVVGICMLIAISVVIVVSIQQNKARQTSAAENNVTETAQVQSTATAEAQVTATASSAFSVITDYKNKANLVYELSTYSLEHKDDDQVRTKRTDIECKNFLIDITFENPYDLSVGDWDYGFMFRHTGSNDQFRFYITSYGVWSIENWEDGYISSVSGEVEINVNNDEKNHIEFLAEDDIGYIFINNRFITQVDLSERNFSGDILIGTGFFNNHEVDGYSTVFTDLTIYSNEIKNYSISTTNTPMLSGSSSTEPIISVNSKQFSPIRNTSYSGNFDFQIIFENEIPWLDNSGYSIEIITKEGSHICDFPEENESECKIIYYEENEYLVCSIEKKVIYETYSGYAPPYYCDYTINLLQDDEIIHTFQFSHTFDRP
jgi:serine/threonine protein kinase